MLEKEQFDKWLSGARGYLTQTLNAYEFVAGLDGGSEERGVCAGQQARVPASGIGTPGEKAATAIADFIVVDMFANYCTGAKDAKSAIADAERQLKRIYR